MAAPSFLPPVFDRNGSASSSSSVHTPVSPDSSSPCSSAGKRTSLPAATKQPPSSNNTNIIGISSTRPYSSRSKPSTKTKSKTAPKLYVPLKSLTPSTTPRLNSAATNKSKPSTPKIPLQPTTKKPLTPPTYSKPKSSTATPPPPAKHPQTTVPAAAASTRAATIVPPDTATVANGAHLRKYAKQFLHDRDEWSVLKETRRKFQQDKEFKQTQKRHEALQELVIQIHNDDESTSNSSNEEEEEEEVAPFAEFQGRNSRRGSLGVRFDTKRNSRTGVGGGGGGGGGGTGFSVVHSRRSSLGGGVVKGKGGNSNGSGRSSRSSLRSSGRSSRAVTPSKNSTSNSLNVLAGTGGSAINLFGGSGNPAVVGANGSGGGVKLGTGSCINLMGGFKAKGSFYNLSRSASQQPVYQGSNLCIKVDDEPIPQPSNSEPSTSSERDSSTSSSSSSSSSSYESTSDSSDYSDNSQDEIIPESHCVEPLQSSLTPSRRDLFLQQQRKKSNVMLTGFGMGSTFLTDFAVDENYGKSTMFFRLQRIFRLVALASHFTKYLSKILKNPVQWGWEYDPDANFAEEVANPTSTEKTRNIVSAVDFAVGHLFSKNSFQGWLTANMRSLFRKPPEIRTEFELSEMQVWCSSMKAFRKYPVNIQKELLRVGRYERWHSERMIVGENQKGMFFYVILDGEIEMFKMDREGMDKDRKSRSQINLAASSESVGNNEAAKRSDDYERQYRVALGTQTSGESFGELAFVSGLRIASAITKRTTEFLLVERDDYLRIVQDTNDVHSREKLAHIKKIPLFKTLSANLETIALYCDLKSFPPDSVVVCEGDPCEYIFFQRSGTSRLVKSLQFCKVRHHGGYSLEPLHQHHLHHQAQQPQHHNHQNHHQIDSSHPLLSSNQQQPPPPPPTSTPTPAAPTVVTKFVVIQKLFPGDYYFDGSESINPNDLAFSSGSRAITAKTSVVTNIRSEFLVISKIDFNKFATKDTWRAFSNGSADKALPPLPILNQVYSEHRKWSIHKKQVVAEIMEEIRLKRK
ncbi:hypothetical protein BDR26DRAFT_869492 [Obelidium mucronatum]|nr:hypothetical protein BDR26DRAFT_869492 [Obelidium mucronatum]